MADDRHSFSITTDRLLMLGIAAVVAFGAFRDETRAEDEGQRTATQQLTYQVENLTKAVEKFEEFMEEPRFTETSFNSRMVLRDARLAAAEGALATRAQWMDEREDKDRAHDMALQDLRRDIDSLLQETR